MTPAEIARALAEHADRLSRELLPGGHLERNRDWRCGSVAGEAGTSLIVTLAGHKRGRWRDFATGNGGDMLDLVAATQDLDPGKAMAWARCWLGLDEGEARVRPVRRVASIPATPPDPDRWRKPWGAAGPIAGTVGQVYLTTRGLAFADPHGDVLRFNPRRVRLKPGTTDQFEHHPALLALLREIVTGEPCGIVNVFLLGDGRDRLRDAKGKTVTGKAGGGAIMLGRIENPTTGESTICGFEDVTYGLTVCEGVETAIAVEMSGQSPVWALGGAANLGAFPVLAGIEALTIAADTGTAGQRAAQEVAARWRQAGREVRTITPPIDDWAAEARRAAG